MAKKSADAEFNMSEEIRNILRENRGFSGREVINALKAKFPSASINENSAGVAFSSARKKLGIAGGRTKRRAKPVRQEGTGIKLATPAPRVTVGLATLQAAAKFLGEAGNAASAIEAIRQVQALQIK